jgi:hypothetical protein
VLPDGLNRQDNHRYLAGVTAAFDRRFCFRAAGAADGGVAGVASLGSFPTAVARALLAGIAGPSLLQSAFG